jgi:hypothetical protein
VRNASAPLKVGDRVILLTFNGQSATPDRTPPEDNYWLLIGESAEVIKDEPSKGVAVDRVLVRFYADVEGFGLHCHNEIRNSLWIKRSDLRKIIERSP